MALFLVVLGGAAAVEVHRAITGNGGNKDVQELKQKEETLRRQLQVRPHIYQLSPGIQVVHALTLPRPCPIWRR